MARNSGLLIIGTLVSMGIVGFGCSSDEGEDDLSNSPTLEGVGIEDGGGSAAQVSTPDDVSDEVFQTPADTDGDGSVTTADIVGSGAAVPVSKEALDAFQDQACAAWQFEPEPLAASLFFIVDASSSMAVAAENTGGLPKWDVTRDAIAEAIGNMPDGAQVGLLGYPNTNWAETGGPQCVNEDALFPAAFLGTDRDELIDALNAIRTQTCTPTHDAYRIGVNSFSEQSTSGQKYVLLMTDGQPTVPPGCGNQDGECSTALAGDGAMQEVIDAVRAANDDRGIKTFILGSPGSELHMDTGLDNRWWLSRATEAGDTMPDRDCSHDAEPYCHFDMTVETDFASGLNRALADIVGQVAQCDYAIPPPSDPSAGEVDKSAIHLVLVSGGDEYIEIYQSRTSDCSHGWYLDGDDVKLCPSTCEVVKADPSMELQWLFGCAGVRIEDPVT